MGSWAGKCQYNPPGWYDNAAHDFHLHSGRFRYYTDLTELMRTDRPNLRAESAAEGAFDDAGDLAFEASEDTHELPRGAVPCYGNRARARATRACASALGASATNALATAPTAMAPETSPAPAPASPWPPAR